jgi:hypothetical protein
MKITVKYTDIGYNSSSTELEAFRRALEIRSMTRENGNSAWVSGVETCVWTTPLCTEQAEVETVTVCEESGVVTYARIEVAIAC